MLQTTGNKPLLDQDTIDEFADDGVTILRQAFTDWVDILRDGIAANRKSPGPDARTYQSSDNRSAKAGNGEFFGDYCNWQRIPQYHDFIFNSDASRIGKALMGSDSVQLFHEHVLVKDASADVPTPWHQDKSFYSAKADKTVSLWVALDDVPLERTLEFIRGSHKWGKIYRPDRFNGEALNENDDMPTIPDFDSGTEDHDICRWALKPGDAVAFDFRTVHGAQGNSSASSQRRAFSLRLLGENAQYCRSKNKITSPPFSHINLADGAELVGDDFPILIPPENLNSV